MWNWIYYLWYRERECQVCGTIFLRVREKGFYQEFLDLFRKQEDKMIYVCCMGCAMSMMNKMLEEKS